MQRPWSTRHLGRLRSTRLWPDRRSFAGLYAWPFPGFHRRPFGSLNRLHTGPFARPFRSLSRSNTGPFSGSLGPFSGSNTRSFRPFAGPHTGTFWPLARAHSRSFSGALARPFARSALGLAIRSLQTCALGDLFATEVALLAQRASIRVCYANNVALEFVVAERLAKRQSNHTIAW